MTAAVLLALALPGGGALLALIIPERRMPSVMAVSGTVSALLVAVVGAWAAVASRHYLIVIGHLPVLGVLEIGIGPLSGFFLATAGTVFAAVSVASAGYLGRYLGYYSLRAFSFGYHLLLAAVVAVLVARDLVTFFVSWEIMSVLAYLLVIYEHRKAENVSAGFAMLAAGEIGTMAALIGLLMLTVASGGSTFTALAAAARHIPVSLRWMAFWLTFLGFGVKAGLFPSMSWLPRAHPAAPANASALLSGVILNLGIYGIIRSEGVFLAPLPVAAGLVVMAVGAITALLGILYANTANDLKRMLAHSSIENMGLVAVGLGAAFTFLATGHPVLAAFAYVVALYHAMNHGMYKSLLFLGAGAVDQSAGTRQMNRLGGLAKAMPWTSGFFLVGVLSIAALPPFNGFSSEWLLIQNLLRSVGLASLTVRMVFALSGVMVALTIGLAVTAFVKVFAMSFLGLSRSPDAKAAGEAPPALRWGMGILAGICLALGLTPTYVVSALSRVVAAFGPSGAASTLVPPFFGRGLPPAFAATFAAIGSHVGKGILPGAGLVLMHRTGPAGTGVAFAMSPTYLLLILAILLGATYLAMRAVGRQRITMARRPWDGGRHTLWPEATYTATGFASPVRVLFQSVFRWQVEHREVTEHAFRIRIQRQAQEPYVVDQLVSGPLLAGVRWISNLLATMHHGRLNLYIGYAFLALVAALLLSHAW
jgi:hydrogenase-4 component B